jgi:hypothetical protein
MAENNTLDIVRGISQVMAGMYDAYDPEGERTKTGLKREEGHPIYDKRVIDGFKVKFDADRLCVNYHGEVLIKDIHRVGPKNYERELEEMFRDITKFIKKEYKIAVGKSLTLKDDGPVEADIERMSNIRSWVKAQKYYVIGGVVSRKNDERERESDPYIKSHSEAIRKFLSLSSKQNPKNRFKQNPPRPGLGEVDKG